MSPMFIKEFKRIEWCKDCRNNPQKGRKFCATHLTKAREVWMLWSLDRRKKGVCSYCRKMVDQKGTIRCRFHRVYNIQKCNAWSAIHGVEADKRSREKFDRDVAVLRAQGDTRSRRQIRRDRMAARVARRETLYQELSLKYPQMLGPQRRPRRPAQEVSPK